jgi:hypothetical protein
MAYLASESEDHDSAPILHYFFFIYHSYRAFPLPFQLFAGSQHLRFWFRASDSSLPITSEALVNVSAFLVAHLSNLGWRFLISFRNSSIEFDGTEKVVYADLEPPYSVVRIRSHT